MCMCVCMYVCATCQCVRMCNVYKHDFLRMYVQCMRVYVCVTVFTVPAPVSC